MKKKALIVVLVSMVAFAAFSEIPGRKNDGFGDFYDDKKEITCSAQPYGSKEQFTTRLKVKIGTVVEFRFTEPIGSTNPERFKKINLSIHKDAKGEIKTLSPTFETDGRDKFVTELTEPGAYLFNGLINGGGPPLFLSNDVIVVVEE